jgi:hypothetical protein
MRKEERNFFMVMKHGVEADTIDGIEAAILEFCQFVYEDAVSEDMNLSNNFVDEMINLLRTKEFLRMREPSAVLSFFESDWGRFSKLQKSNILNLFDFLLKQVKDGYSLYLICYILGVYVSDDSALTVLANHKQSISEITRAYIAYGIGQIALDGKTSAVIDVARKHIMDMASDTSTLVRAEAKDAIFRIEKF